MKIQLNKKIKKTSKNKKINMYKRKTMTSKKSKKPRKINGVYKFSDHPEFTPNLSPKEMFELGSFGGTYWRPIYSSITKKNYKDQHKKYPKSWWKNVPDDWLTTPMENYNKKINRYGVQVGTSLEFWEDKGWIEPSHPYGWAQWYCDFFTGKRCKDDERQISRWRGLASTNGRFFKFLVTQITKKNSTWDDETVSPKIRQVLQHWGYKLTKKDFDKEIKHRKQRK